MSKTAEIRQTIADAFIAALDAGTIPWRKPWAVAGRTDWAGHHNLVTGRPYSGINPMILGLRAMAEGWGSMGWATFKQVKAAGGSVRKGEKGTAIVFWKKLKIEDQDSGEEKVIPMLRHFTVFNRAQCDGLPDVVEPVEDDDEAPEFLPDELADLIVESMPRRPDIFHRDENRAYYRPSLDYVVMPPRESFVSVPAYYSTLFHELAHSTGHEKRLDRKIQNKFGSDDYGREELVAEITAAYLCTECGIGEEVVDNQAAYVQHWARAIKADPDMVLWAAGKASKAADYIIG